MSINKHDIQPIKPAVFEHGISDLFNLVMRRRYIFIVIFGLTLLLGICVAILAPKQYMFSRYIQIGSYTDSKDNGEELALVQKPEQLVDAIQLYFIPIAWSESRAHAHLSKTKPNIQVRKISDAGIISIEAKAGVEEANAYDEIFKNILNHVVDMQRHILTQKQRIFESKLSLSQAELAARSHIPQASEDNEAAVSKKSADAPYKLFTALTGSSSTLRFILEPSNFELRTQIQETKIYLASMQPTQFISEFKNSGFPVGLSSISITGLFTLLGLVLGVIGIFIVEAITKVQKSN